MNDITKELTEKLRIAQKNMGAHYDRHIESIIRETLDPVLAAKDAEIERLDKENTCLRSIVAKAKIPCVYCGKENIAECPSGFPGCAQADDMMAGEDEMFRRLCTERKEQAAEIERLKANVPKCTLCDYQDDRPAVCFTRFEGHYAFACDDCCSHDGEVGCQEIASLDWEKHCEEMDRLHEESDEGCDAKAELARLRALCGRAKELDPEWITWNETRLALLAEFEQAAKGEG